MQHFRPFTIERPWGQFRQLSHNSPSTVKVHRLLPGGETSLQSHSKRGELWHIVSGSGKIFVGDQAYEAVPGAEYEAPVGAKHRWLAGPEGMILVEVADGDFDEEDITRYEDKYGRA